MFHVKQNITYSIMVSRETLFLYRSVIILFIVLISTSIYARKKSVSETGQIYIGGGLGLNIPTKIGRESNQVNFTDVARLGFVFYLNGMWMQSEVVGIGAELNYLSNPYNDQYWINLTTNYRGSFDAYYRSLGLNVNGKLFFGKRDIRPYFGVFVGGNFIMNYLSFVSDPQFVGTTQDATVSYNYQKIKLGFGGDLGVSYKLSNTTRMFLNVRLSLIPFLDEVVKQIKDSSESYYYNEYSNSVVMNPHGCQNTIMITVGLNFGVRNKRR